MCRGQTCCSNSLAELSPNKKLISLKKDDGNEWCWICEYKSLALRTVLWKNKYEEKTNQSIKIILFLFSLSVFFFNLLFCQCIIYIFCHAYSECLKNCYTILGNVHNKLMLSIRLTIYTYTYIYVFKYIHIYIYCCSLYYYCYIYRLPKVYESFTMNRHAANKFVFGGNVFLNIFMKQH